MDASLPQPVPARTQITITCTKCGKAATVPFTPTPGRPVFCRDCFVRPTPSSGPSGPSSGPSSGSSGSRISAPPRQVARPRKRMMAQGRKAYFMYDAKAVLVGMPGGMEDKDGPAFLEGVFARGARQSTEAAQEFLDEKFTETLITLDQRNGLGRLVEKYSFYR